MNKIAVVGAGLVGRSWAIVFARAGHPVALYDNDPAAAERARSILAGSLADLHKAGLLDETAEAVLARIQVSPTLADALAGATYVQENALEKRDVKIALFRELDAAAEPDTIIASSTSAIPASAFTEQLPGRARCLVAHPVNPPHLVPIVEICPAPWTDPGAVEQTRALQESVGQAPILVKREIEGFILNRLQGALLNEAFRLVEDDYVSAADLDLTLAAGLGLRWSFMGPFETIDLNAPGGIADYARRFGDMYYRMATEPQAAPRRWSDALIAKLEAQRRAVMPMDQHGARSAWRDRRLMALAAHKRKTARDEDNT